MSPAPCRIDLAFEDNRLLPLLFGEHNAHLARIEHQLGVSLASRGNRLTITGPDDAAETARTVLDALWARLRQGQEVGSAEVDAAVRLADVPHLASPTPRPDLTIATRRRIISARTPVQADYIAALRDADTPLIFALGPAGTGKTYLAAAQAVAMLTAGAVDRVILSRPAVEAGERLGFLPGDLREKVDPYLRPLYDALYDMLPAEQVTRQLDNGTIEIAPLAFMRGRTLANAFVILDEAQNTTAMQMRMFLTRMGEDSRMVVTGDMSQTDLPRGERSGLRDAVDILDGIDGVRMVTFTERDVVRHPLVTRIVRAYDAADRRAEAAKTAGHSFGARS